MAEKVIMPKLEMAQETGKVVEWLKHEGERVEKGEPLIVIETDKVTVEIEASASGILAGIRAEVGDEVPISTVIAYLLEPGEELPKEEPVGHKTTTAFPEPQTILASPVAQRIAATHGINLREIVGTGPKGQIIKEDVEATVEANRAGKKADMPIGKVRASPAARRLARERGLDLSTVTSNEPGGRIHAADVASVVPDQVRTQPQIGQVIPLEGIRRTIAERMTRSYLTAPHITFTVRVDMGESEKARERANVEAQAQGISNVSVTAFIVMAIAWALKRNPFINSVLHEEEIHLLSDINIGVAVALDVGLIVPVLHQADRMNLAEVSTRLNELVSRARDGQLSPADVAGGTFTVSNLGPYGIEQFTAIINPPQTAILAVGVVQLEAVPDEKEQIVVRSIAHMTLSADHRVVDGVIAARFLADVKQALEQPWLLQQ